MALEPAVCSSTTPSPGLRLRGLRVRAILARAWSRANCNYDPRSTQFTEAASASDLPRRITDLAHQTRSTWPRLSNARAGARRGRANRQAFKISPALAGHRHKRGGRSVRHVLPSDGQPTRRPSCSDREVRSLGAPLAQAVPDANDAERRCWPATRNLFLIPLDRSWSGYAFIILSRIFPPPNRVRHLRKARLPRAGSTVLHANPNVREAVNYMIRLRSGEQPHIGVPTAWRTRLSPRYQPDNPAGWMYLFRGHLDRDRSSRIQYAFALALLTPRYQDYERRSTPAAAAADLGAQSPHDAAGSEELRVRSKCMSHSVALRDERNARL